MSGNLANDYNDCRLFCPVQEENVQFFSRYFFWQNWIILQPFYIFPFIQMLKSFFISLKVERNFFLCLLQSLTNTHYAIHQLTIQRNLENIWRGTFDSSRKKDGTQSISSTLYRLFAYTNNYIELNEKYNQDISGRNDFMWRHKSQVFVQFSWLLFSERQ